MTSARLLPELTDENRPFWTGGVNGQLLIVRCQNCDLRIHPPQRVCRRCLSLDVKPEPASGQGTIYSMAINYQPWLPNMDVPFVYALVDLDDQPGVRLTTNIVDCDPESVAIGMPVTVKFEQAEDIWLPMFVLQDQE